MPLVYVPLIDSETGLPKPMRKFGPQLQALAKKYNGIIDEFKERGITISLRKLYYEMVQHGGGSGLDAYVYLKNRTVEFRYNKLMDVLAFEDEGRYWREQLSWNSISERLDFAASTYRLPMWVNQQFHPLVMIEKDALLSVIEPVCTPYDVPYFACKGYSDIGNKYKLAALCADIMVKGRSPVILHLGDHDPTGLDATRDLIWKIQAFWESDDIQQRFGLKNESGVVTNSSMEPPLVLKYDSIAEIVEHASQAGARATYVCRLGLNYDQVERGNRGLRGGAKNPLLENPELFKIDDTRAEEYISDKHPYGHRGWELDALDVDILQGLIAGACDQLRDIDLWNERTDAAASDRVRLNEIAAAETSQ